MRPEDLRALLVAVAEGRLGIPEAERRLAELPFSDLGFAKLDLHRELRSGHPEAVFGESKAFVDLERIVERLITHTGRALVTRVDEARGAALSERFADGRYHDRARVWSHGGAVTSGERVCVVAAGTSDLPVAEEAAVCLEWFGHPVERLWDVGVAGVHRLLSQLPLLRSTRVVVAVAGMDGALPTLVAGLVSSPVIAVPTSVGYGASFDGLAPLLTMLNACAPGVAVVNIDNGYGAAVAAARILHTAGDGDTGETG